MTHLCRLATFVLGVLLLAHFPGWPSVYAQDVDSSAATAGAAAPAAIAPLVRTVDLSVGESAEVKLVDGSTARLRLVELRETRDEIRQAVRGAEVTIEVNGTVTKLTSATYRLPAAVGGIQIDCPVTRGYTQNSSKENVWALEKDARFRVWPAGSPWVRPGTFVYPARQRWFASDTQMANEPTFVDGGEMPGQTSIYYHYGLDFGGAEGLVEVIAATDGIVVSAAEQTLPEQADAPIAPRYDVIYILDGRGWYYRYSHLKTIDVQPGQRVTMRQRLGLLGKEGGSGGWSHLHFDITSRQPSGQWGIQDGYAYVWQAYHEAHHPPLLAIARPHQLAAVGQEVTLDGSKSWSGTGKISAFDWTFQDASTASGPLVTRSYTRPGTYSEILRVTDDRGNHAWDFAVVDVLAPSHPDMVPPTIHAAYYPTTGIQVGDEVTFKVRTFRTTHGEELWNFGDGTAPVRVRSDGNVNMHAEDGYAVTTHRFAASGDYIVSVERANERGETATAHLVVHVEDSTQGRVRDVGQVP
jgi:murein DD-endopeptidase MepM/ murein hydrolase activator NlpD